MASDQEAILTWRSEDSAAASSEGWDIFETSRSKADEQQLVNGTPYGHRPFELQRCDDTKRFASDDEAHRFVRIGAQNGNELAAKALAYLQQCSAVEYAAVMSS